MAIAVPYRMFRLTKKDLESEAALNDFVQQVNLQIKQLTEAVNFLLGNHGNVVLQNTLDMGGKQIINVGASKETLG